MKTIAELKTENSLFELPLHQKAVERKPDVKFILDACCGGRMFWFNKHHPNAIYIDNLPRAKGTSFRPNWECSPDIVMDFTKLEFEDKKFKMVVWDPPHLKTLTETSEMRKRFGCLNAQTWQYDLKKGFSECWRVLEDYGVLIFKWNEEEIPSAKVLELFGEEPLFGHTTGSKSKTKWYCFMKIPEWGIGERKGNSPSVQEKPKKEN